MYELHHNLYYLLYCHLLHLFNIRTVQCIHLVTKIYVKMGAPADNTSLSTCVIALQCLMDLSARLVSKLQFFHLWIYTLYLLWMVLFTLVLTCPLYYLL